MRKIHFAELAELAEAAPQAPRGSTCHRNAALVALKLHVHAVDQQSEHAGLRPALARRRRDGGLPRLPRALRRLELAAPLPEVRRHFLRRVLALQVLDSSGGRRLPAGLGLAAVDF